MEKIDLSNYIQNARSAGIRDDKIREGLLQSGWVDTDVDKALSSNPAPQATIKSKWRPTHLQRNMAIFGTFIILTLAGIYAYISYIASNNYNEVAKQAELDKESIEKLKEKRAQDYIIAEKTYINNEYGFSLDLLDSWDGYSVIDDKWEGRDMSTGDIIDGGQIIMLRHPLWTDSDQREDMPIMVFNKIQWDLIQQEKMSVGAAPIPPSLLDQNSRYILALPARYNYDYKTGWEEVDQLVHELKAFEPSPEGQHCGGFIQNAPTCPNGYTCQLNINNPDTGGVCVKN